MKKTIIITIDGPAGTGKTTVAREVARKLGYCYFDTGAMFRSVTYEMMRLGLDLNDETLLSSFLKGFHYQIRQEKGEKRYFVNNDDVTEKIRSSEVNRNVSRVSAHPFVREALGKIQREFANAENSVFEGRDMGTVVFPKAQLKIFLTARPAVRAERRYLEIKDKMEGTTKEEVLEEIMKRDHFDSTRLIAPLKQAEDAHLIDTSDLSIEEVIEQVIALAKR